MSDLTDSQRAQLLLLYKEKLQSLGEETFFDQFDEIRRQCYEEIGFNLEEEMKIYCASQLGRQGGKAKSEAKSRAARENGKKSTSKKEESFNLSLEDI